MKKLLIIDDDAYVCNTLKKFLEAKGFCVAVALTANNGLKHLRSKVTDFVLCDYRLPDADGSELFRRIRQVAPNLPVVFMTAYSDLPTAVRMIRAGARDYVTKPLVPEEVHRLVTKNLDSKATSTKLFMEDFIAGHSPVMKNLMKQLEMVAPTDLSVLVEGETGSGKEYIARAIHFQSKRADKQFMALDCGAMPGELANSELFGHVKGAFTGAVKNKEGCFEQAQGGTLFLDEIGNLSHDNQMKLLRTLQEQKVVRLGDNRAIDVDVRIIVATNEDLQHSVAQGSFREDLYHRINGFKMVLPPLRKRREDILLFATHFLNQANLSFSKNVRGFDNDVQKTFLDYGWPGNIRELQNIVNRCVLLTERELVTTSCLPEELLGRSLEHTFSTAGRHASKEVLTLKQAVRIAEREIIKKRLKDCDYNKTKTAQSLGVDRKTLYNKMREYNMLHHQ